MTAVITAKAVTEATGDHTLLGIRQLLLREKGLERFESACAQELVKLEVLSLSRNRFRTFAHFENFINLQELNMNFNQLESLEGLLAPNLQKLFLSNNRLSSVQHIGRFPRLTTLCVFRNMLPDLEEALAQLRTLPRLREVALDGNPCARHADYRHRVLHGLPRLESLDEERVEALDREMAAMAMAKRHQNQQQQDMLQQRPGTAPSRLGRRRPLQAHDGGEGARTKQESSPLRPSSESAASRASESDPSLLLPLRHLNANPLVLDYLAQSACTPLVLSARGGGCSVAEAPVSSRLLGRTDEPPPAQSVPSRPSTEGKASDDDDSSDDDEEDEDDDREAGPDSDDVCTPPRPSSSSSSSPSCYRPTSSHGTGSSSGRTADVSDPYLLIRKLLKTVEVLKQELQHNISGGQQGEGPLQHLPHPPPHHGRGGVGPAPPSDLEREVEQLRTENRMMWILKDENKALADRVQELESVAEERDQLVQRLTRELEAARVEGPRGASVAQAGLGCSAASVLAEEKEEEEEGDEEDREILRLINRNARTLTEIREDMMQTKVELEVRAMVTERQQRRGVEGK